jgi:hypothetical protein
MFTDRMVKDYMRGVYRNWRKAARVAMATLDSEAEATALVISGTPSQGA